MASAAGSGGAGSSSGSSSGGGIFGLNTADTLTQTLLH